MNREKIAPELAVEKDALIGEGAVWDADDELLYWVDILGGEVYVYDPVSGINRTIPTCQAVGTVVKRQSGGLVVALHNGFAHIDLRTERMVPLGEDPECEIPANRFNDGKCDPAGRLWAGTMEFGGATGIARRTLLPRRRSLSEPEGRAGQHIQRHRLERRPADHVLH